MKIGTKLVLFLTLPLITMMLLFGYLSQRATRTRLHAEMKREARGVALTTRLALEDYLRDRQLEDIRELAQRMSGYERILGLRVFAPDGSLVFQSRSLDPFPFDHKQRLAKVLQERVEVETLDRLGREPAASFLFPLIGPAGELQGAAQLFHLESYILEDSRAARNFLAVLTAVMILGACGIVLTVTRVSVSRPIDQLVRAFREVGGGSVASRVPDRRRDELGRLANEFNAMCERLQAARDSLQKEQAQRQRAEHQLRDAEPLASIGRLSAGLAHEIGTPLNVIGGRAESLRRRLSGNEFADKNLEIIVSQIDRIARIVPRMLNSAHTPELRLAPTPIVGVLKRVLEFLAVRMEEAGVVVESSLPSEPLPVMADSDQIYEVFLNLATNALDAMPHGGKLLVRAEMTRGSASRQVDSPGPYLAVSLEDTGIGIPREHLVRIFDPYFTTKGEGKGTGLGLSVSHGIVKKHGGWIAVDSQEGRGTCLTVYLPLREVGSQTSRNLEGQRG